MKDVAGIQFVKKTSRELRYLLWERFFFSILSNFDLWQQLVFGNNRYGVSDEQLRVWLFYDLSYDEDILDEES